MLTNLFKLVLQTSILGSVAVGIIILIKLIFKNKFSARWHYWIWVILFIRLAIPISLSSNISVFNILSEYKNVLNSQVNVNNENKVVYKNTITNQNLGTNINELEKKKEASNNYTDANRKNELIEKANKNFDWWYLGSVVWVLVAASLILFFALAYIRIQIKLFNGHEIYDNEINELVDKYRKQEGIKLNIKVYSDGSFDTPCVFGILKPSIIFPRYMLKKIDNRQKSYMVMHEIMHIKGKDNFINIFSIILQAINWFNPILWYAFIQIRKDCEFACDERVVYKLNEQECKEYALTLISIADEQRKRSFYKVTVAFGESNIKRRVKDIMKFKKQSIFAAILAVSVMISTSVVVLTDAKNQENVLVTQDFSSVNQIVVSLKNSKFQTKYDKKALLPKINSQIMKELYYSICNNTKNIKKYINPSERYRQESDPKFIISIFYKNGQKDDIRSTETAQFIFKFLDSKGSWTGGSNEKVISSVENIFGVKSVVPTKVPLVVNKTIYKNFNYKYMMNMPSSWVGNYAVCETECGTAFNFVGKSDVSKSFNDDKKTNQGLNMFYIGTKQQMDKFKFYDSSKKIGTINKVDYYYFTQPDYPIGILKSLAKDRKKTVLFVNDTRVVESMQKEIRLMQNDFEIATKMQKDIGDMLKTFRPIQ